MDLINVFRESFIILRKEPKLFIPKLILAFLYGIGMIIIASLALETILPLALQQFDLETARAMVEKLPLVMVLFFYLIALLVVDVLVNAMYPLMVSDFKQGKKISFRRALGVAATKFTTVFPAVFITEILIAVPFALVSTFFILSGNMAALIGAVLAFFALSFVLIVLFYVIYPFSVLNEKKSFIEALTGSFKIGRKNIKELSIPSTVPYFLSLVNFVVAFKANDPTFLIVFVVLRFLIAMLYTYHMILNPNVYLALEGRSK